MLGGCLGQGVGQLTNAIGIERMGVSRSVPIQSSTPIFSVTFAMMFLGERPRVAVIMGTLLIVAGVCLLSITERRKDQSFKNFFQGGLVYPLTSSLSYALLPVLANVAFSYQKTPIVGFACAFTAGTVLLAVTRPLLPDGGKLVVDRRAACWFLGAGITTTIAAIFFWTAMSIAPVSTVLPLSRLVPCGWCFGPICSWAGSSASPRASSSRRGWWWRRGADHRLQVNRPCVVKNNEKRQKRVKLIGSAQK